MPFNLSFKSNKVGNKPCVSKFFATSCCEVPNFNKVFSASAVGPFIDAKIAFNCVAPSAAFVPVLDIAAIAAATWSKETPILDAKGITPPIAPANADASSLPSRTAAVKISVAPEADKFSVPYAFIAEVDKSAIVFVSPNPTAAAFKDISKTSIAAEPLKPAEVIKNNASAASFPLLPVSIAIFFAASPISATLSAETPTSACIDVIDLSKSKAILTAAAPTATNGKVNEVVIDFPTDFIFPPNAWSFPDADERAFDSFELSPVIFTFKF